MKKLLSLFLTLTMVLSCTALAAAPAEDLDPPLWQQYGYDSYDELIDAGWLSEEEYTATVANTKELQAELEEYKLTHADELAAFDADVWFADYYSNFGGGNKAEYMASRALDSEAAFREDILTRYVAAQISWQESRDAWAALQAEAPERVAQFLAGLDDWLAESYLYGDVSSFEEYMEQYSFFTNKEGAYLTLYNEWNAEYAAAQQANADRDAFITERGGVVGALNVMLDGQYLAFSEGRAPYAKGGVTYADAATLSGALGVDIPAPIDGYVSIRSAAEAAGLKVWWDGDCQSVVLIDVKKAAAEIDKDFTILNGALAKWKTDLTKNYKAGMTVKADVTLFDSLDGDKTGSMTYALDILLSAKGMQMTGKYDMTRLMNLLLSATASDEYAPDADTLAQAKAAMKGDFELRWDFEKAMVYMKASALDWYYKQMTNATAAAGAWFPVPLDGLDFETLLNTPAATYGGIVCGNIDTYSLITTPVYYYDTLTDFDNTKEAFGDACFTKSGSNYTLTLGRDDFAALMGQDSEDSWYDAPEKFDLTLTLRPDGSVSGKVLHQDTNEDSYYYGEPATRVTADFNFSLANQKLTLEVHGKNTYKVVVTMSGTTSTTTKTPAIAPPDGATVVED